MLLLALLLNAATLPAGDNQCTVTAEKGDQVRKNGNVVIESGETVGDALAIEGNVIVKSGATVKSAIALHGSVTVEAGATVAGSVVAIGGKVRVSKQAKVGDSQIAIDDSGLHIVSDDGSNINLAGSIAGHDVAKMLLAPILAKIHGCVIVADLN